MYLTHRTTIHGFTLFDDARTESPVVIELHHGLLWSRVLVTQWHPTLSDHRIIDRRVWRWRSGIDAYWKTIAYIETFLP